MSTEHNKDGSWRPGTSEEQGVWTTDINFDLPIARYVIAGVILAGAFLGISWLGSSSDWSNLSAGSWVIAAAIVVFFIAMPVLRRLYLRRKRRSAASR